MHKKICDPTVLNLAVGTAEGITEVRRQEALLKTGALQDAILNSANFSSIATDEKGVIQIFNVGAERMLGYAAADVLNKITPADISDPQEVIARAKSLSDELGTPITPGFEALVFKASRGIEDIYELTYIRKDGSRFPAIVSVTALRDAQGGIIGYLLIGTDNTARKQVEAERRHLLEIQEETNKQLQQANVTLRVSEEKLAVTLHSIGDAVIATDAEACVTLLNPLAEQLTGWTQAQASGHPVDEVFVIINKETRLPATIPVMATLAHGTIQGLANHTVLIARGGDERDIADSCAPIRDRDGQVVGAVLVFRDVTEEYEVQHMLQEQQVELEMQNEELLDSQRALKISRARYLDLYDLAPMGYCTLSELGLILEANITAATLLGLPRDRLVKQPMFRFIFEEDASIYYQRRKQLTKTGEPQSCELRMAKADGTPVWVQLSILSAQDDDVPVTRITMMDISERKQAEEALLKAGALQSAIFNSANFSSIATDAKGVIQIFNVGAERMLGYTAADVMNKITPADISDPQEVIARAKSLSVELETPIAPGFEALVFKASRGIEDIYELTYIRKDGSRFPAVVSVTALRDAQNTIIGYLLIGTDNTARKQAEEALLKAGALQSAIFNSANFSSIATDAKGVIQIFNVGAERMLGYTAADVMNKITPADISDPQEVIARAKSLSVELETPIAPGFEALVFKASRGIEDIYELTYIRKDGSRFPAVVSVTALRDAQNTIIGYLLIGTDNTARKQIEAEQKLLDQRLRDHQFYTRSLFESNIDALMTTDPLGIISDVNQQMESLTGCTRDELIGTPFKSYFTDPERAEASIKLVLSEKKVTDYELTARAKNGEETVVSYNATTFYDRDGQLQGVFAAARDITERKRLDQVLLDKNVELEGAKFVAEKANLAKSDFLSSMSHELRTPLNAILGFAQLLEVGSPPPTAAQIVRLHQIIKAGWYLLELINQILDLAVIESGKLSLSREAVSLTDVMHECQGMIESQAQQRDIHINFLPFDSTWFANADRTRVKQVLTNLLSNAIKYNREHGMVEVKCVMSTPERIRISIKDSGAGLPPEKLAQLFQPFNRLGQENGAEEGTGIGLVVTKQLVELMGGTIGVESIVGVGSEFWVELIRDVTPQLAAAHIVPAELAPESQGNAAPITLLYVEDNPANLMLVEQIIEGYPHMRMLSARDGNLGIALARVHLPDVILMDINLPGISGFQVLRILREDPLTASIPVLAISANAMSRDVEKGLEAGFFRYLTKPIKVKEFMEALDVAMELAKTDLSSGVNPG
jgi:PAS domain S-box-containing protein